MSQYVPDLFEAKAWSTNKVFNSTKNDFIKLKLSFTELPILNDVDVEADLGDWAKNINIQNIVD